MRSRASSVVVPARRMKLQSELWASSSSRPAWVSQSRCSLLPTPRFTRRTIARDGKLPINIKVLIEGEEEDGGDHLEAYVPAHREALQADAALICDTEMFAPNLPTLCTGLRGGIFGELHVEGAAQDLHSGVYGGAAPNPLEAIAHIIAALKGTDGRIKIPGFYDAVESPAPEELAAWRTLPFNEEEYRQREVGSPELTGEAGFSVLERTWSRPTFEVHGIVGGFVNKGFKTVIPAKAHAKISGTCETPIPGILSLCQILRVIIISMPLLNFTWGHPDTAQKPVMIP